jgi:hypothetical protein
MHCASQRNAAMNARTSDAKRPETHHRASRRQHGQHEHRRFRTEEVTLRRTWILDMHTVRKDDLMIVRPHNLVYHRWSEQ